MPLFSVPFPRTLGLLGSNEVRLLYRYEIGVEGLLRWRRGLLLLVHVDPLRVRKGLEQLHPGVGGTVHRRPFFSFPESKSLDVNAMTTRTRIDWDEVDFLQEEGYWPEYRGDYHRRKYEGNEVTFEFKTDDFWLDYLWAVDAYRNRC